MLLGAVITHIPVLDNTFVFCLYCCTVHFEDSLSIAHQQMH
jgi:hypothetical protein